MTTAASTQKMNIVIVGHVDHGKSTVIGRLLADTNSLPQGKLEQVQAECRRSAKPFEYAFLLDALKDEQEQGITIDTARCFFKSASREYIIIDAPGHIEFLKNMISGAARAEAALLVIDAKEGIRENSKRHGYLLSMLGIRQVAVCVNKMDLVNYDRAVFENIEREFSAFLREVGLSAQRFIPIAARPGENIISASPKMAWFDGPSVLEVLDGFRSAAPIEDKPFRMPVQAVYKFTEEGDDRRIVAGRVESGTLRPGDAVVFLPSNKRSTVRTLEAFNAPVKESAGPGESAGVTLSEQIYIHRGEILCKAEEPLPQVSTLLRAELFWMGKRPLQQQRLYKLKLAAAAVPVRLKSIERVLDASDLSQPKRDKVERHDVAQCVLETLSPIAFDLTAELEATGRFVIVDEYTIAGGGIITEAIADPQAGLREGVARREESWDSSIIAPEDRARAYGHSPVFVLLTGAVGMDKKTISKELEKLLFHAGAKAYLLGFGNLLRSLSGEGDLQRIERREHVRRMGEVAHLFLDAGMIVIATASNLDDAEWRTLQEVTDPENVIRVHVGEKGLDAAVTALRLERGASPESNAGRIITLLRERGILTSGT